MLMYLTTYIFMRFRNRHLSPPALHFLDFLFPSKQELQKKKGSALVILMGSLSLPACYNSRSFVAGLEGR